jgi:predicted 3-demethylubiquinone-9 3-methyltransferase (glyoxalase superfamily)
MSNEANMSKIAPCLWFDGQAEEAAKFYVSLLPDSRIDGIMRSPADTPSGPAGMVLTVDFTLAGQKYMGLNGGPQFRFTEAVSFMIHCEDQAEVDRLWEALIEGGGAPVACGWLKDRFGLFWQIVPKPLMRMIADPDRAKAKRAMEAMMRMVKIDIAAVKKAYDGG